MELRVVLAALGGFFIGCAFVYVRLRSGLSKDEWLYFKAFLTALRDGNYEQVSDERKGNDE